MEHWARTATRPLRNRSKESLTSDILESTKQNFERAKSLLRNFGSERNLQTLSPDMIDVFRLKERINQEFERLIPDIHLRLRYKISQYNEQDVNTPVLELQNRVNWIIQAMCSNKYKTINPDLTLNGFNVLEHKRFDKLEESVVKYQKLNSARIK